METYLYLSLIPEALIYSQLPPDRFGKYLAIGDKKLTRGSAIFFAVDPAVTIDDLDLAKGRSQCVAHPDGSPRRSTYMSVYGVLAKIPLQALGNLYLATKDGMVLELAATREPPAKRAGMHLYQEICPVFPKVASPLAPYDFCRYVTDPRSPVYLPRVVCCDLRLNGLATDPEKSSAANLPYPDMNHLRECLTALQYRRDKMTKIVHRDFDRELLYYTIDRGFYVGDQDYFASYLMPTPDELESKHHLWWASASSISRF
jgi:hypothetical protein